MLVGLIGKARAGKDTAAAILVEEFGFTRFAFADALKDAFAEYHGIPRCWCDGIEEDGTPLDRERVPAFFEPDIFSMSSPVTIRQGLQRFGMAMREQFGEDFWVDRLAERLFGHPTAERFVITDVRFDNEVAFVRGAFVNGGTVLGVDRPDAEPVAAHASEELADRLYDIADTMILNDGPLEQFQHRVREWARKEVE